MRSKFDDQLDLLNTQLIEMGAIIENAIQSATDCLLTQDAEMAKKIIRTDSIVNQKEREIEDLCLKLILSQQPVARDLRLISSALKIITDMERIGDQSANIAELVLMMAGQPYIKELIDLPIMAKHTIWMVNNCIDAFVKRSIKLAESVIKTDDVVDELFVTVRTDLIEMIGKDISVGSGALDLLMVAKYYERIGDHAVNIAEWVIYSITGIHTR